MINIENVDLAQVYKLYPSIINIEEYYSPVLKWTSILSDKTNVRDEMLYYGFDDDRIKRIIVLCVKSGAVSIQFKCKDENDEYCYPDYKVSELII